MRKKSKTVINIARVFASILSSRDIIDKLRIIIERVDRESVDLDFQKVKFISRSAAHELILIKEDFKRKRLNKKEISFINVNDSVKEMLRVVAANRALPKDIKPEFKAKKVNINVLCV